MKTPNHQASSLKHGIAVATVVVLSIPGALTVLSPLAMTWASTGGHAPAPAHSVAAAQASKALRAG